MPVRRRQSDRRRRRQIQMWHLTGGKRQDRWWSTARRNVWLIGANYVNRVKHPSVSRVSYATTLERSSLNHKSRYDAGVYVEAIRPVNFVLQQVYSHYALYAFLVKGHCSPRIPMLHFLKASFNSLISQFHAILKHPCVIKIRFN